MAYVSDNFVRADGALGSPWGTVIPNAAESGVNALAGGILISNDGVGPITSGGIDAAVLYTGTSFPNNNQWASAQVKTVAPYRATLHITGVTFSAGQSQIFYTVTQGSFADVLTGGAFYGKISGLQNLGNNGTFNTTILSSGSGYFVIANASGVTESGSNGTGICPSDSGAGVCVYMSGTSAATLNGYFFHCGSNSYGGDGRIAYYELWKVINGAGTLLVGSGNNPISNSVPVVGDTIALQVAGTGANQILTVYYNGKILTGALAAYGTGGLFRVQDSSISSGVPGLWSFSISGPAEYQFTNWHTVVNPPGNNGTTLNNFQASNVGTPFDVIATASDSFTYSNGDLHAANANWVYQTGTFAVSSDKAYSSHTGVNNAYRSDLAANSNQYSEVTAVVTAFAATQNCGPAVFMSASAQTFYCLQYANNLLAISMCKAGVFTGSLATATAPVTGDVLRLYANYDSVNGTVLTAYKNGVAVMAYRDTSSPITSGQVGIFGAGSATSNGFSSWAGGLLDLDYSISGNAGAAGATVSYSGAASGSVTALSDGSYVINGLAAGSYTITPSLVGYTFSPTSASETVSGADITSVNFGATQTLVATPTFSPVAGSYGPTQNVTISSTDSGLAGFAITYTTDGTTPVPGSHGTVYSTPVAVASSLTIKAIASATGYANSAEADAAYIINGTVATPTFSPVAGTYTSVQSVTISCTDSGLTGFAMTYTTDGTTPVPGSHGTVYSGPISVGVSETIKVVASATGYANSVEADAAYVISLGPVGTGYSVPDCRKTPFGPNSGVVVQGTIQYTGQISSNPAVPTPDSRKATPADSRQAPNIPENSRTSGVNGPGN